MVVAGSPADYDEWGEGWSFSEIRPYLDRARSALCTAPTNTAHPAPFHTAFLAAAQSHGLLLLDDPDDPRTPVGVAPFPANVVDGQRWNAALAYLDDARSRPNLVIEPETVVDRMQFDGTTLTGVLCADGRRYEADLVILAAGAYFSPAILMRSGIGPEAELRRHQISIAQPLPVGERLLDHCGTDVAWQLANERQAEIAEHARESGLFEAHSVVKAASTTCAPGSWNLHVIPWIYANESGDHQASAIVFHMKPLSSGRLRLRSSDPREPPIVERGFLTCEEDVGPLVEGIELARAIGNAEPLRTWITGELSPGGQDPEDYLRNTVRNYFHPAGTCAIGAVVDAQGAVLGIDGLYVADASIMPTIPRANTNLTVAAIAERVASTL
jgi:choline dehydrogenase